MSLVKPAALEDISKEDFVAYEEVRVTGATNMLNQTVEELAGISREVHMGILVHYDELNEQWPDVRQHVAAAGPSPALPAYKSPLSEDPASDIYPPI